MAGLRGREVMMNGIVNSRTLDWKYSICVAGGDAYWVTTCTGKGEFVWNVYHISHEIEGEKYPPDELSWDGW
jgi:hypothetical protein